MSDHDHQIFEVVEVSRYEPASALLRALTAPIRLAIVDLLNTTPLCVHELVDALDSPQPLVSQHLKVLRSAGLVRTEKRGRETVYLLADDHVAHIAQDAYRHATETKTEPVDED